MSTVYFDLSSGDLAQDWSDASLIGADNGWGNVPSIVGYRGDDLTPGTGTDARTITGTSTVVNVSANQTNPTTLNSGGLAEFAIANPVVGLNGSGTADAPYLALYLNATGRQNVVLSFNARDLDASQDNAIQQVAVQYRLDEAGAWQNVPGGYIADATVQGTDTTVTPVSVTLPADANGVATLQVRILTTNAIGNDEWVGIDDIRVTSSGNEVQLLSDDFSAFTGGGFQAEPGAGQLDSDVWRVGGLSDNLNPAYGGTYTTGDFARGQIVGSADPFTAGVYSPGADGALVIQPTGAEVDVGGFIESRIVNSSGSALEQVALTFDWSFRNSGARSSALELYYSTDGSNFTRVDAASFSTPGALEGTGAPAAFSTQNEQVTLNDVILADGGSLYLRWVHAASTGSGNRDEFGIDNVSVDAVRSSAVTARIDGVTVTEGNDGTTLADFVVTRSSGTGTATVDFTTVDGTAIAGSDYVAQSGTLTFAEGETTKTISVLVTGDDVYEPNETFSVRLTNPVGLTVPSATGVGTINNDDSGAVTIMQIQGEGHRSAYAGLAVETKGIVTYVDTNGFYLQDEVGDGNARTSDAVFVFTGTAPTVSVGDGVTVGGTVTEFGTQLPVTEIAGQVTVTLNSQGNAVPEAVLIGQGGLLPPTEWIDDDRLQSYDPATDGADFWESLEGMRVTLDRPSVVANTTQTTSGSNTFVETDVVVSRGEGATGLNDRGGITISPNDNINSGGDYNPEKIQIDTSKLGQSGLPAGGLSTGDGLNSVTGIVNYAANRYEVIATAPVSVEENVELGRETTTLAGFSDHLSIATYNMENLDASDGKFDILAGDIVFNLRAPDIIAAQEIQDADGAGNGADLSGAATAQGLIDALAALGKNYAYVEVAPTTAGSTGGEPGGNIRNGYFYNVDRVDYVEGSAELIDTATYAGTRRPLVAEWQFNGQSLTTINVHFTSRGGSDPLWGANQPPADAGDAARTAQAAGVKAYINDQLATDPQLNVAVLGDFNGFYFEKAQTQLTDPTQGGVMTNLAVAHLSEAERYSYLFEGNNQLLDNILVSNNLVAGSSYDSVHINSQFGGERPTDHDPQVALLYFAEQGFGDKAADDFNGDGQSDILWRNADGTLSNWLATGNGAFTVNDENALVQVGNDWQVAATGDFNGDGRSDILWRNADGRLSDWLGDADGGFTVNDTAAGTRAVLSWQIAGTGDFNGDGKDDILWRNEDGSLSNWLAHANADGGFTVNDGAAFSFAPTSWQISGTGDFNGDGKDDILWRNQDGTVTNWLASANGDGAMIANDAASQRLAGTDWNIAGTGDINNDGRDDIVWRNVNGDVSTWLGAANGAFTVNDAVAYTTASTDWQIVRVADYNGDGRADILWRNDAGDLSNWLGTADGAFVVNDADALTFAYPSWSVQPDNGLFL